MYGKEVVVLCLMSATCQAFWWPSNSQPNNELEDMRQNDQPSKQMPYGYFRSLSYVPMLAYPPYYYNSFLPWQNDASSRMSPPYGPAMPFPTATTSARKSYGPVQSQSARFSEPSFADYYADQYGMADFPTAEQALESDPATIMAKTTTTTTTTTSTESAPITTDSPTKDPLPQVKAQQSADDPLLEDLFTTLLSNKEAQSSQPTVNSHSRIGESTNTPSTQQPSYYPPGAKILAERDRQNIQFIPCMCPITMSSMQQFSASIPAAPTATVAESKHPKNLDAAEASTQPIN